MASLWRPNVHNADLRVAAPDTADSHVIVIVSLDPAARRDLVRHDDRVGLFLSGATDLRLAPVLPLFDRQRDSRRSGVFPLSVTTDETIASNCTSETGRCLSAHPEP